MADQPFAAEPKRKATGCTHGARAGIEDRVQHHTRDAAGRRVCSWCGAMLALGDTPPGPEQPLLGVP